MREYLARRTDLGFFVTEHVTADTKFVSQLADHKPLIMRGTANKQRNFVEEELREVRDGFKKMS